MKSPHVCHISTMTQWGGVERVLVDYLSNVDQSSILHSLLTTSSVPAVLSSLLQAGVTIYEPKRHFRYDPSAILQMAQWLRSRNVYAVHAYNGFGNAWGYLAASLARTPIFIAGEHGSVWRIRAPMYWLNRLAYQNANLVVANSKASKTLICHRYNIHPQKIRVVYNIVAQPPESDRQEIRTRLGLENEIVIGSIGRLVPEKGYTILVDAAKKVLPVYPNVRFLLIGGGSQEQTLAQYIHDAGVSDKFILTGWRSDARELLNAFDIFVSTSIFESFGNALVEAAMAGIPVIAPYVDGIPEAVEDNVTGRLLPPTEPVSLALKLPSNVVQGDKLSKPLMLDSEALAGAILEFVGNDDLRRAYGEAGRRRARTLFSVTRYMSEIQSIYTECLGM